jgi:hypothetical protein
MALYYDLPVYEDVNSLILKIFEYTRDFPREYKYTLGQDLKRDGIVLVRSIYRANKAQSLISNAAQSPSGRAPRLSRPAGAPPPPGYAFNVRAGGAFRGSPARPAPQLNLGSAAAAGGHQLQTWWKITHVTVDFPPPMR